MEDEVHFVCTSVARARHTYTYTFGYAKEGITNTIPSHNHPYPTKSSKIASISSLLNGTPNTSPPLPSFLLTTI